MARQDTKTAHYDLDPRVAAAIDRVLRDAKFELAPLSNVYDRARDLPAGVSVPITALPSKGLAATVELAGWLSEHGFKPIPHLAARMITNRTELAGIIARLDSMGVTRAFVVGGDPEPAGEFFDGLSLLEAMDDVGHPFTEVGIPAYPEGHNVIPDDKLVQALRDKQPYANYMTTQMCFDPSATVSWLKEIRQAGITLPVHIGLPGVAPLRKLIAISTKLGIGASLRFLSKQRGMLGKLARPGGYAPDELLVGLASALIDPAAAIENVSMFTFNEVDSTELWRRQMMWDVRRILR